METFPVLLAIWAGNSLVPGEFIAQRPVTRSFDVTIDLHPNKRLSKQWWVWWFDAPSCPLWRHCNDDYLSSLMCTAGHHGVLYRIVPHHGTGIEGRIWIFDYGPRKHAIIYLWLILRRSRSITVHPVYYKCITTVCLQKLGHYWFRNHPIEHLRIV